MRVIAILVAVLFGLSGIYILYKDLIESGESQASGTSYAEDFTQITLEDIQEHMRHMTPVAQKKVLEDAKQFRKLVNQENRRRALLKAAALHGTADEADLQYQVRRRSEELIIQRYVNQRLIEIGIPKGFPTEKQVTQFYENNQALFTTSERIPVWQIFWGYSKDMGDKEKVAMQQQAAKVAKQLKTNQQDFARLARKYSQHEASRLQGGFMGLLNVDELLPGIKEQVISLKPGQVSDPVVSQQGVHVLLRAATIPPEARLLGQARGNIVERLQKRYIETQRQRIHQEVMQEISLPPDDTKIHGWWQQARSKMVQISAQNK